MEEELGIIAEPGEIAFQFPYRQDVYLSSTYIDRQFSDVYVCQRSFSIEDIYFDPQAASKLKLASLEAFEKLPKSPTGELAPVYQKQASHIVTLLKKFDQKAKKHQK